MQCFRTELSIQQILSSQPFDCKNAATIGYPTIAACVGNGYYAATGNYAFFMDFVSMKRMCILKASRRFCGMCPCFWFAFT